MAHRSGFDDFVVARSHRLLRVAYLLTREHAAAEDLLQEALTKAWFAWPRISGDAEPYVRKIIATSYVSQLRHRWYRESPSADIDVELGVSADTTPITDDRDALWRALSRLPPRQRAVVVLRFFEDMSEAEVAETMHCSVGTVKSQTSKALVKLRVDTSITPSAAEAGTERQR